MNAANKISAVMMSFLIILATVAFADALSLTFDPTSVQPTDTEALIKWQSDEISDSEVVYGINTTNVSLPARNATPDFNHSVLVQGLNVSTTYYYKIRSTNQNGTVELNNSDTYYSFTTIPDVTPPFINLTIPRFYNSARLVMEGTTEPRALVHAYANPDPGEVGILFYDRETFADSSGNFAIVDLPLDASMETNNVVIWVRDRAGNVNTTSGLVTLDLIPPNVTINIPAATSTGALLINGTTDENITLLVYVAPYNDTVPAINDSHLVKNESVTIASITPFSTTISLSQYRNLVRVIAQDLAGNQVIAERAVLFDSVPPFFEFPTDLSIYSPSYTREVNIEGKISEQGNVSAYVNGRKQDEVQTDAQGNFKIEIELKEERVDINDTGLTATTARFVNGTIIDSWDNQVTLQAKDISGLTTNLSGAIIYALCGVGTWWNIERPLPAPDILSPALLLDGNAQLAFNYRLTWQGLGEEGKITRAEIVKAPLNRAYSDFYDEDWATDPATTTTSDRKTGYAVSHLTVPDPTPPGLNWTYYEKLRNVSLHRSTRTPPSNPLAAQYNCKVPGFGCVKLPLMLEIEFTSGVYNGTQKQCWDVEVQIDASLFITDFIPNEFLNATVELLGGVIDLINVTLTPIREVAKITAYVCLGTIALQFWHYFRELFRCRAGGITGGGFKLDDAKKGCPDDNDPDSACKKCADAMESRMKFEERQAWVCDRIFMPSAPTLQKYVKDNNQNKFSYCNGGANVLDFAINAYTQAQGAYQTPSANIFEGATGTTEECERLHPIVTSPDAKCCGVEYKRKWNSACVFMDELKESACLQDQANVGAGQGQVTSQVQDCHPLWNSAAGFCERRGGATPDYVSTPWKFQQAVTTSTSSAVYVDPATQQAQPQRCSDLYYCVPQAGGNCNVFDNVATPDPNDGVKNLTPGGNNNVCLFENPTLQDRKALYESAYCLKNCEDERARSSNLGIVCRQVNNCEIILKGNAQRAMESDDIFFRVIPRNLDTTTLIAQGFAVHTGFIGNAARFPNVISSVTNVGNNLNDYVSGANSPIQQDTQFVVWPKDAGGASTDWSSLIKNIDCTTCIGSAIGSTGPAGCSDFGTFRTNLNSISRIVVTQDDACRVYNEIRAKMGQVNQDYIVDPANAGLLRGFQCIALPSMISHLAFWQTVLSVIRNCFVNIMTTGEGSPTVCREVLSVYICDMIYNAIKCFSNRYDLSYNRQEGIGGIGNVLGALTGAGSGVARSLNDRYGGNALFQSIFDERRLVHAVCLFAFTGDWVFDIDALFDADFPVPINSTVLVEPRERRFISANPISTPTGLTMQNYKIGVAMVAGADLTFAVRLICSDDYSCSPVNGFEGGKCDCVGSGKKEIAFPLRTVSNSLRAGEALGPGGRGVAEYNQFEDKFRYDRVEVTWKYRDANGREVTSSTGPLEIREAGGRPPAECEFDDSYPAFRCTLDIGREWFTILRSVTPARETFDIGESLQMNHLISQRLPDDAEQRCAGNPNCEYTTYLAVRILNQANRQIFPVQGSSVIDYYSIPAISDLQTVTWPEGITLNENMFGLPTGWTPYPLIIDQVAVQDVDLRNLQTPSEIFILRAIKQDTAAEAYSICSGVNEQELQQKIFARNPFGVCTPVPLNTDISGKKFVEYKGAKILLGTTQFTSLCKVYSEFTQTGTSGGINPCGDIVTGNVALLGLVLKKTAQDTGQACTDTPQTWKVTSKILAAEFDQSSGQAKPSSQTVFYQGQPQEKTTEIKVRCRRPTTTGATDVLQIITITTNKVPAVYSASEPITINVYFSRSDDIQKITELFNSLKLKKAGVDVSWPADYSTLLVTSSNAPAFRYSRTIPAPGLSDGSYQICDSVGVCKASFSVSLTATQTPTTTLNIAGFDGTFTQSTENTDCNTFLQQSGCLKIASGSNFMLCTSDMSKCLDGSITLDHISNLHYKIVSPEANYYIRQSDCQVFGTQALSGDGLVTAGAPSIVARLAYALYKKGKCKT